jgi:DNA replication protein DnaC
MSLIYEVPRGEAPAFAQLLQQRWERQPAPRLQQYIQQRLGEAGLPAAFRDCTFARLDPRLQPEAFPLCQAYAQAGEYQGKKGLLLLGQPGSGKTSLAVAILHHMVDQTRGRCSVQYWNVPRGLSRLRAQVDARAAERESVRDLLHHRLVVLDDLGQPRMTEWVAEQFYQLIDGLWAEERAVVVTTHLTPAELQERLDEAVVSRLLGMCHRVRLQGKDLRLGVPATPPRPERP